MSPKDLQGEESLGTQQNTAGSHNLPAQQQASYYSGSRSPLATTPANAASQRKASVSGLRV